MIVLALFVGTHALTTPLVSDVPPTPSEAVILQFSADASADDQRATADIISKRLNALGMTPDIRLNPGSDGNPATIRVLLPGGDDFTSTAALIRQPGDFELVDFSGMEAYEYQDRGLWTTHEAEIMAVRPPELWVRPDTNQPFTTILDNTHLMQAQAIRDDTMGTWTVHVVFDQEGGGLLGAFTAAHIGDMMAIVVDGYVLSTPVIQSMISGEAVIQGNFVESEARALAAKIGFGALPVPLELVSIS